MDPIMSILNSRCETLIDKIEFKKGTFSKDSKPFTMKDVKISYDNNSNTIIIKDINHEVGLDEGGIVLWDYESGIKHEIESGFRKIGFIYTKESMFKE